MTSPLHVLIAEDSDTDAKLVLHELQSIGRVIECQRVESAEAMREALDRRSWDLVISDWSMPRFGASAALAIVKERKLDLPFIIVSGTIGEDTAVEAMRAGAHDYVLKDNLGRLTPAVERELRECSDRVARRRAEEALRQSEDALRRSEDQLRQMQKMEAVGRLAGGVAHDFNNVLSVILSYAEIALEEMKPDDPVRASIEQIMQSATRAAGLTRQLLMVSRQQVVEPKVIDLNELLADMHPMLQRILGEDVALCLVPPKSSGRVEVQPSHVEQVVLNLVVNARDAMPKGGTLTIETTNVVLDEAYISGHLPAKTGPHVMLAVTDTGMGMDRETQARIFEPFFTTKETGKGTGLGLSTVFGIVRQSGGTIWVYSEPGRGTTFKVYLPRVDAELDVPQPSIAPATLLGDETILLVEDEEQVREVVVNVMRRHGYRVIAAENAGEALLLCERHPGVIHLLVTDVVMPKMSGPELAARLTSLRPGMKVLCMSGYTDDSVVRHGVLDDRVAFIQKPLTPASLTLKIREVLNGGAAGDARADEHRR